MNKWASANTSLEIILKNVKIWVGKNIPLGFSVNGMENSDETFWPTQYFVRMSVL